MIADLRFQELLDGYLLGEAAPQELAELETRLRDDSTRRRQLVEQLFVEAQLHRALSVTTSTQPAAAASSRSTGVRRRRWALVAGGLGVFATALVVVIAMRFGGPTLPAGNHVEVGAVRVDGVKTTQLPEERIIEVDGTEPARVRLADGSSMELEPASKATISHVDRNRPEIALLSGSGTFRVVEGPVPFTVTTPVGSVTALGTEFRVRLPAGTSKKLDVAVLSGRVRVTIGGRSTVLSAGTERVFGDDGARNDNEDGQNNNRDDGSK